MAGSVGRATPLWARHVAPFLASDDAFDAGDGDCLRARLGRDGYLYLPGIVPREIVQEARKEVLSFLAEKGKLASGAEDALRAAPRAQDTTGEILTGTHAPGSRAAQSGPMRALVEARGMQRLFALIFGCEARAMQTTWLRVVGPREKTTPHADGYFFRALVNSRLLTCWMPLGDVPRTDGPLAVCAGSHHLAFSAEDAEEELPAGFWEQAQGLPWHSSGVHAGDCVIFTQRTVHASLPNAGGDFRISCDARWKPVPGQRALGQWPGAEPERGGEGSRAQVPGWVSGGALEANVR